MAGVGGVSVRHRAGRHVAYDHGKLPGGGTVFTGLTGLWLTSSLWFFGEFGLIF